MMTVRTYKSVSEADRAVTVLKNAGVSAFTREITEESFAQMIANEHMYGSEKVFNGESTKLGIQVRVVEDAAYKANQVLDVLA